MRRPPTSLTFRDRADPVPPLRRFLRSAQSTLRLAASAAIEHAAHMCKNIKRIPFCAGSRCARVGGGIGSARRGARPVGGVAARSRFDGRGGGGGSGVEFNLQSSELV